MINTEKYDALLFVSFGGPEGMDDVMPFLDNVLRGKNVPEERKKQVADHYKLFDGVSPINAHNRKLIAALKNDFNEHGLKLPVYWGNRNWHPFLADTMKQMSNDGVNHALAFVTSAYASYSGCRQYLQDIKNAQEAVKALGVNAPVIDKIRLFFNHPGFIEANFDHVMEALEKVPKEHWQSIMLIFTAHSIPKDMAFNCRYEVQLKEASSLVVEQVAKKIGKKFPWQLVYQSRSGPPTQPWLEPDICDYLRECKTLGITDVIVIPIGFVCDHLEVVYDLDYQANKVANEIGINLQRAATAGVHPAFIRMIRKLVLERIEGIPYEALGKLECAPNNCPDDCCLISSTSHCL